MKLYKKIFIGIFVFMLVIPLFAFNFKEDYISAIDNRKLKTLSFEDGNVGNIIQDIVEYINDRIGFREELISQYTTINDKVFNELVHPIYTYGKDGYVFMKINYEKEDYEWVDRFVEYLAKLQEYCQQRGTEFLYSFTPSKTTVYSQYLPDGVNLQRKRIKYLFQKLDEKNINYVDNTGVLIEESKNNQVFNIKYDAGHWNDLGAFTGTNNVLNALNKKFSSVKTNDLSDYNLTYATATTLPVSNFSINEEIPGLELKNSLVKELGYEEEIKIDEQYHTFSYTKNSENTNNIKAMVFQGSYFNGREKFMANQFSEYVAIHNYSNIYNLDYYLNVFEPDCVVFETAEYVINDTYFDFTKMGDLQYNQGYETYDDYSINTTDTALLMNIDKGKRIVDFSIGKEVAETERIYLKIGDKIYDGSYNSETKSILCSISLDAYKDKDIKVILVDTNQKSKTIYNTKKQ